MQRFLAPMLAMALLVSAPASDAARRPDGELRLETIDADTAAPLAVRITLVDGRGRHVPAAGWGLARLGDHAYLDGGATLGLRLGAYRFELDAGPEYRTQRGDFKIERHADDQKRVEFHRFADLAGEGWRSIDTQSARPAEDMPLIRRVESIALAPAVGAAWRDGAWTPFPKAAGARATRGSSAVWYGPRGVVWLVDVGGNRRVAELPQISESSVAALRLARESGWLVLAGTTSFELPLWLAEGVVDGLLVIDGAAESPALTRADDDGYYAEGASPTGPRERGRRREAVYLRALESGLDPVPVAGSGSGLSESVLGDARVLVRADDDAPPSLADGLARRAVVVTSGPLLRPSANGLPPGATIETDASGTTQVHVGLNLATRRTIDYLELLKNGKRVQNVRLAAWAASGGKLPPVEFDAPGWLAVRAVTDREGRYDFALSAAWRVENPGERRVSRAAAESFARWLAASRQRFGDSDPEGYERAEQFWSERIATANAD